MKKILTLILFLACNAIMFSQEKDSLLVGEWKVIYIQTHNMYYNALTDSLTYTKEYTKLTPRLIKDFNYKNIKGLKEQSKKKLSNDQFVFEDNGIYLRKKEDKVLREGNYTVNNSKKTISFKDKDKPSYSMKYSIKKGLLCLKINFKGPVHNTKFTLQKVTTP